MEASFAAASRFAPEVVEAADGALSWHEEALAVVDLVHGLAQEAF